MANTLSINTFTANSVISSSQMNNNFTNVVENAANWQVTTLTSLDLGSAAASQTLTAFNFDPKETILGMYLRTTTAFGGGAVSNLNFNLGLASDLTKYSGPINVLTSTASETNQLLDLPSYSATTAVYATFSATGGNVDTLTQGTLEVHILKNLMR
jgi:hypothetical protein